VGGGFTGGGLGHRAREVGRAALELCRSGLALFTSELSRALARRQLPLSCVARGSPAPAHHARAARRCRPRHLMKRAHLHGLFFCINCTLCGAAMRCVALSRLRCRELPDSQRRRQAGARQADRATTQHRWVRQLHSWTSAIGRADALMHSVIVHRREREAFFS
jgi:hypothetical protein